MDKRYQVFVSSTYEDLKEERQEVMQALLELECIPAGMELFPAANDDQWTLIKKVIDECDYYIVISGGRYGSLGKNGQSYTEMEYRYALSKEKPIIGFLHKDLALIPSGKVESDPEKRQKLEDFRALLQEKMCKFWSSPVELGSVVSRSMINLIKSTPTIGWIRANEIPDPEMAKENIQLRKKIDDLETKLHSYGNQAPSGSEHLAQGNDTYNLFFNVSIYDGDYYFNAIHKKSEKHVVSTNWNEIIKIILPKCIPECTENTIRLELERELKDVSDEFKKLVNESGWKLNELKLNETNLKEIIVQLKALGLIVPSNKKRSLTNRANYWTLTPYGENMLSKVCAITRDH